MRHFYRSYGLCIESSVELPELTRARPDTSPDLVIEKGIDGSSTLDVRPGVSEDVPLEDGVAVYRPPVTFTVEGGTTIRIESSSSPINERTRHFLLGIGLAHVLYQRGDCVLRGSGVRRDGRAIALLGESGAGKSTVAAALYQRGYGVIGDSLFKVRQSGETPHTTPGFPCLKLEGDDASSLTRNAEKVSEQIDHYRQYYRFDEGFLLDEPPVAGIFVLSNRDGRSIERYDDREAKQQSVITHAFRPKRTRDSKDVRQVNPLLHLPTYDVPQNVGDNPEEVAERVHRQIESLLE